MAKITFGWSENDKALIEHGLDQMEQSLRAAPAKVGALCGEPMATETH